MRQSRRINRSEIYNHTPIERLPEENARAELVFQSDVSPEVDSLDAFELIYLASGLEKCSVAGDPDQAFAVADRKSGILYVYARNAQRVKFITSEDAIERVALDIAARLDAKFTESLDSVTCSIGDSSAQAFSRGLAAMRAIVKLTP